MGWVTFTCRPWVISSCRLTTLIPILDLMCAWAHENGPEKMKRADDPAVLRYN